MTIIVEILVVPSFSATVLRLSICYRRNWSAEIEQSKYGSRLRSESGVIPRSLALSFELLGDNTNCCSRKQIQSVSSVSLGITILSNAWVFY